jgi:hypothetical protein
MATVCELSRDDTAVARLAAQVAGLWLDQDTNHHWIKPLAEARRAADSAATKPSAAFDPATHPAVAAALAAFPDAEIASVKPMTEARP